MSLAAYQRTRSMSEAPRRAEYRLFGEITGELAAAWDDGRRGAALMPALHRNRELWNTLATACATAGNGLPDPLRATIVSLSLWVDRHTSAVVTGREDVAPLIEVNRAIMEGLG